MFSETKTDGKDNRTEQVGVGDQQTADVAQLEWVRGIPSSENTIIKELERLMAMTVAVVQKDVNEIQKQIVKVGKMRNV
jgi:hypothetical protein